MEIIKGLIIDYLLFSLWDSLVFYLFINKLTKIKLKFVDILVVGAVFCLSSLAPPIIRQILGIIIIFAYIYKVRYYTNDDIKKVFYSLIAIVLEYLYTLVIEMTFSFIYNLTNLVDLSNCIYLITTYTPIIVFGILFDILPFVLISAVVFNKIRKFCGGFHCTSNLRCGIISNMLIIIAGYMSKCSLQWLWLVFLIALISIKDLYIKAPFKEQISDIQPKDRWYNNKPYTLLWNKLNIDTSKYDKPYDIAWYRKGMIKWIVISLFFAILFLYLKLYLYTSCILWSIILCDITLFLNKDDFL